MLLVAVIIGSVLASLIPALVVKVLMSVIFGRSVSYLLILLGMAVTFILTVMTMFALGYTSEENLDAIPSSVSIGLSVGGLVVQAFALSLIAPDQNMERIAAWRWGILLILQYVVYFAIALLLVLVFAATGTELQESLNLMRVV